MAWEPSGLVSMEMDDDSKLDSVIPGVAEQPDYPYGLRICLTDKEMPKLGLSPDCRVGDDVMFMCRAVVTSVSSNSTAAGQCDRVELQICDMCVQPDAAA